MTVIPSLRRILSPALASKSDAELLARFTASRDETAFAALYDRHGSMVRAVCRRHCRDPHLAADAEQGVWLVLARRAAVVSRPERLANWLFGVAVRVGRKAAAARPRESRGITPALAPEVTVSVLADELLRVLDEELAALPEAERLPLVLCYLEGRTQDEAARVCGTCLRTLRRRLERGRVSLRRRLEQRGVAPAAVLGALVVVPNTAPASTRVLPVVLDGGPVPSALSPWVVEELAMTVTKARWLWVTVLGGLVLGGTFATAWTAREKFAPAGDPPPPTEPTHPISRAGVIHTNVGEPNDKPIRTVYVPMFNNRAFQTTPYRGFEVDMTMAVVHQISKTTRFRVTSNYETADTELLGNIVGFTKRKLGTNQLNQTREAEIDVIVDIVWRDLRDGTVLSNPHPGVSPKRTAPNLKVDVSLDPNVSVPSHEKDLDLTPPMRIVATGHVNPELGETTATCEKKVQQSVAIQIVELMENRR